MVSNNYNNNNENENNKKLLDGHIKNDEEYNDKIAEDDENSSQDDALCEMLGITSLKDVAVDVDDVDEGDEDKQEDHQQQQANGSRISSSTSTSTTTNMTTMDDFLTISKMNDITYINDIIHEYKLHDLYCNDGIVILPKDVLYVPSNLLRRMTNELIHCSGNDDGHRSNVEEIKRSRRSDKTYETINTQKVLTRMENFVHYDNMEWYTLCHDYISKIVSAIVYYNGDKNKKHDSTTAMQPAPKQQQKQRQLYLYKEKLNIKPPGGSGYAPHVDTPSLLVPWSPLFQQQQDDQSDDNDHDHDVGESAFQRERRCRGHHHNPSPNAWGHTPPPPPNLFVTIMIAIDDMNQTNGCLRVARGANWNEQTTKQITTKTKTKTNTVPSTPQSKKMTTMGDDDNKVDVLEDNDDDVVRLRNSNPILNPDGDGRAGALCEDIINTIQFDNIIVRAGTIVIFHGHVPHRSSSNNGYFSRRAVFLTYHNIPTTTQTQTIRTKKEDNNNNIHDNDNSSDDDDDDDENNINTTTMSILSYRDFYYRSMERIRTRYRQQRHMLISMKQKQQQENNKIN